MLKIANAQLSAILAVIVREISRKNIDITVHRRRQCIAIATTHDDFKVAKAKLPWARVKAYVCFQHNAPPLEKPGPRALIKFKELNQALLLGTITNEDAIKIFEVLLPNECDAADNLRLKAANQSPCPSPLVKNSRPVL